jgi:hypothetical protein
MTGPEELARLNVPVAYGVMMKHWILAALVACCFSPVLAEVLNDSLLSEDGLKIARELRERALARDGGDEAWR